MLAVVAHDAGGAEVLSSYVRQRGLHAFFVLEGPAVEIFKRKLGVLATMHPEAAVPKCDSILCGSSWQSDLEVNAIRSAKLLRKHSIAFLDHWTNYRSRFVREGETYLPDEIWVGDALARNIAAAELPELPIRVVENPYFLDIKRELAAARPLRERDMDGVTVLYVAEPVREHGLRQFGDERHWGYVEEDALRFCLANISVLRERVQRIRIRTHPSEPAGKYNWAQHEFDLPIDIVESRTLVEDISESDVVIGCQSTAMVVGLLAGKRVVSCIPPGGAVCALPHPTIEHYQELLTAVEQPPRFSR